MTQSTVSDEFVRELMATRDAAIAKPKPLHVGISILEEKLKLAASKGADFVNVAWKELQLKQEDDDYKQVLNYFITRFQVDELWYYGNDDEKDIGGLIGYRIYLVPIFRSSTKPQKLMLPSRTIT